MQLFAIETRTNPGETLYVYADGLDAASRMVKHTRKVTEVKGPRVLKNHPGY